MRPNPASSLIIGAAMGALVSLTGFATRAQQAVETPEARYQHCLALTNADPQAARQMAATWRQAKGGFPAQHCEAVAMIKLGQYVAGATRLEELAGAMMQASPVQRGRALEQAGQAWLLAGDVKRAAATFDAALALLPNDPELLIDHAQALFENRQYRDAIDDLNRVLKVNPNHVEALIYRAAAYRQTDALNLALGDADRALALAPNAVPALLERGNIRRLAGDAAGAQADWLRVIELAPQSPAANAARSNIAHLDDKSEPREK